MTVENLDTIRIRAEYERRAREIPRDFYSLEKPENLLMRQQALRGCLDVLRRNSLLPLSGRRIADIGCGLGTWLTEFVMLGADPQDLAGIDLMPERIERARRRVPNADLRVGSAAELPWADESFDIVSQMLVFENIFDPALKQAAASEMLRITRPGGGILWFDIRVRNPNNPQIKGLPKKEIKALFPGCEMTIRPAVLAPPLSRWIAPRSWWAAETLNLIPLLRTHYTALIRKPGR